MKKSIFLILVIFLNFTFAKVVFADEEYLVKIRDVVSTTLYKNSNLTTSSKTLYEDEIYTLNSTKLYITDSSKFSYQITYSDGTVGYVNANDVVAFIDLESDITSTTQACIVNLEESGFTNTTYYSYLCFLKLQYPDWNFVAFDTGLDWDASVTAESSCSKEVKSYIGLSNTTYYSDYISSECLSKSDYSSSYYPASSEAVSYHMDPRNFLSSSYIFQFFDLSYNSSFDVDYTSVVKSIISGADFYSVHGEDLIAYIVAGAKSAGISPTYFASKILLELGTSDSLADVYTGTTEGYVGYYNFINWGAYDSCDSMSVCALEKAKANNWYGVETSLALSAATLSDSYISAGQYTLYLQKFNVNKDADNAIYSHQYQTDIDAPSTNAFITFKSYVAADTLDLAYTFVIPIYNNMDVLAEGEFDYSFGFDDTGYSTSTIKNIVSNSGYDYTENYISGFSVGTKVSKVISNIEENAGEGNVVITDSSGKTVTSGIMMTGYKVKITNSSGTTTLSTVIYGDTSGDGEITALDLLQVQKNIVGLYTLSGAYKEAGDTSKDASITALDLLQIQKNIVDLYTIEQ